MNTVIVPLTFLFDLYRLIKVIEVCNFLTATIPLFLRYTHSSRRCCCCVVLAMRAAVMEKSDSLDESFLSTVSARMRKRYACR
jgi:hypothetical protein